MGTCKQSFHQQLQRLSVKYSQTEDILKLVHEIRKYHPTMGLRDMYYKLNPIEIGRDAFELLCKNHGLSKERIRNYRITTNSLGVTRFENLLVDFKVKQINSVWQSDITYFELGGRFYYLTFIIDAYSRKIIGHSTSKRLYTEHTTLPALKQAIKQREKMNLEVNGIIFHSDGGGQYYDKDFLAITQKYKFKNSMCEYAWENGKAERVNGVIKNNYLIHRNINTYQELVKEVDRTVQLYNNDKPHISLQRKTPNQLENEYICNGQQSEVKRPTMELNVHILGGETSLRDVDNNPKALSQL